jgi:fructose-bisphosphate aldolase class II
VLHGASGNTEADIVACIKAGVAVVHINTELRVTYRDSLKNTLITSDEIAPYKFLAPSVTAMQTFLMEKMRLFAGQ